MIGKLKIDELYGVKIFLICILIFIDLFLKLLIIIFFFMVIVLYGFIVLFE